MSSWKIKTVVKNIQLVCVLYRSINLKYTNKYHGEQGTVSSDNLNFQC